MRALSPSMILMCGRCQTGLASERVTAPRQEWWVTPEVWRAEVCAGHDAQFVARALAERGMLRSRPKAYSARFASVPRLCALTW